MSLYSDEFGKIRDRIKEANKGKAKPSASVSKSDMLTLATAMLNSPDYETTQYNYSAKDTTGSGEPVAVTVAPSRRFRNSLKPTLRQMGLDKHDVNRIDDLAFSKETAASMMDMSMAVMKDYMKAGRKVRLPISDTDEACMEVSIARAPERVSDGSRFHKEGAADDTVTVTKERDIIKSRNAIPHWLKHKEAKK